ncbi:MAG: hypothetical protein H7843_14470 [Nitrospirota bacterium]
MRDKDFVKASNGTYDFGYITPETGKAIGRQSAPIRLEEGDENYGKYHIDIADNGKRLEQIRKGGYETTANFIQDVAGNYTEIRKTHGSRLMLVKKNGINKVTVIQLSRDADGDFYNVITGGIFSSNYVNKFTLLGGRCATNLPIRPEQSNPLFDANDGNAQDINAMRTGQSNVTFLLYQSRRVVSRRRNNR